MPTMSLPSPRSSWGTFRLLWAFALAITWIWHAPSLVETRTSSGLPIRVALPVLAEIGPLSPDTAWSLWACTLIGAMVAVWVRGPVRRLSVAIAGTAALVLCLEEALNLKAYDRLLAWQSLVLVFAPDDADGDDESPVTASGFARFALVIVYAGLYGSTGWMKVLFEPAWATGEPLPYFLVDTSFGLRPLGVLASAHPWLLAPSAWLTIAFEALFPFVIWWRRARGPLLALGVALHLGIFALMNVGPFSLVALAAYPVLLGQERWGALVDWIARRRLHLPLLAAAALWGTLIALPLASPLLLPTWPAPFRAPSPGVRAEIVAALTVPGAHVWRAAGSHPRLTGPEHPKTAGERGAVAVLAVLDGHGVLPVALTDSPGETDTQLSSVGRMSLVPGTQRWPGLWGWILPSTSDFLTLQGTARSLRPCLTDAGVNVAFTRRIYADAGNAITDTGSRRSPALAPEKGVADTDLLDVDMLARLVTGLETCLRAAG